MKPSRSAILVLLATLGPALPAFGQSIGNGTGPGHGFSGGAGGAKQGDLKAQPSLPDIRPLPEPIQRLEAGALLCPTEAALRQHQQAILARLSGRTAAEPTGCRLVRDRVAVGIISRHGLAATQVSIPGPPAEVWWTDSPVRDAR
jgi:hypothetical protein